MTTYKYKRLNRFDGQEPQLNQLGQEGWKLVCSKEGDLIFMKEISDSPSQSRAPQESPAKQGNGYSRSVQGSFYPDIEF